MGPGLGPKVGLTPEIEGRRKAIVRLLESDGLDPAGVIRAMNFARRDRKAIAFPTLPNYLETTSAPIMLF